jgi:hypothetical protein
MSKISLTEEVQVLRWFETSPLEVAETVFRIVGERLRLRRGDDTEQPAPGPAVRKRSVRPGTPAPPQDVRQPESAG